MFYANFVLAKKGPLARVWLAAHWEKKLSKAHVFETDLQSSVDNIISPKVKIALRTSGHLLVGVVRIYSRKAKYLLADCTEALIKIKMAFRPDIVDLPLDNQKAALSAITLPELQEWDAMVNNLGSFDIKAFNNNVCRVEDITMKEDLISSRFISDDNFFGDTPFGEISEKEILRDEASFQDADNVLTDLSKTTIQDGETSEKQNTAITLNQSNLDLPMNDPMMGDVGFGAGEGLDFLEGFGMEEISEVPPMDLDAAPKLDPLDDTMISKENLEIEQISAIEPLVEDISAIQGNQPIEEPETESILPDTVIEEQTIPETTLFSRDSEALNLEPIEEVFGKSKAAKRRKRKLIVDQDKIILNEQMKKQINSDEDIIKTAVVAPPTRIRFMLLESSTRTCFSQPPIIQSKRRRLDEMYESNMTIEKPEDLILPSSQDDEVQLEEVTEVIPNITEPLSVPEAPVEEVIAEEQAENQEVSNLAADQPADTDLEMRAIEEELMTEDGVPIAPAFELDNVEKTGVEEPDDADIFVRNVDEEDDGSEKTLEQVNKRWTKRTQETLRMLSIGLHKSHPISFNDLVKKANRKQAASTFYTLLILRKEQAVEVEQDELFGDILIDRGVKFSAHA